ncbi:hypothetical protein AVEN_181945-1 [Araneus ventricosus]|uniref:Uncharacterized protein n=1 Tax=Araneus ventricosus TaxID=182803 RepID=A0A4Y2UK54_ARAVE|nr:hypothetical protein AVEN_181945-1 [Araneus ventricosus]
MQDNSNGGPTGSNGSAATGDYTIFLILRARDNLTVHSQPFNTEVSVCYESPLGAHPAANGPVGFDLKKRKGDGLEIYTPDSKEGSGKVSISLSISCPRKHFRANRFGNHCPKVYVGKFFMNHLSHLA